MDLKTFYLKTKSFLKTGITGKSAIVAIGDRCGGYAYIIYLKIRKKKLFFIFNR